MTQAGAAAARDRPRYVRVHHRDNVAIIVNPQGLPAGTIFPCGLTLRESVPEAHKVALVDLRAGDAVVRYGEVIGHATTEIPRGSRVREELVREPDAPALDDLPLATATPAPLPVLDGYCFDGYRNPDGSVGTRNLLAITTTVQCVAATVEHAVRRLRDEVLPHYPGVDGVLALSHNYGCGVAIDAPGAEIPIRTLRNLARNPNFGGAVMAVSLGCEKLQPSRLFPAGDSLPVLDDQPVVIRLQDEEHRGFGDMVAATMRMAERQLEVVSKPRSYRNSIACFSQGRGPGMCTRRL